VIIATLQPGNYTAIVRGVSNTTGVALVEVYDLSTDTASVLGNISTRSFVQTGNNVMIGGFIVQGSGPKTVIVRAIGPELTRFGVPNALADPALDLHNSAGALIASNNNWQTTVIGGIITSDQVSAIQNSGQPEHPSDPRLQRCNGELHRVSWCEQHHRRCSRKCMICNIALKVTQTSQRLEFSKAWPT
jgi:hypothetical protein